ncbi:MAG: hypothetical protein AABX17_03130 [Nanoarchaeota archaeon]
MTNRNITREDFPFIPIINTDRYCSRTENEREEEGRSIASDALHVLPRVYLLDAYNIVVIGSALAGLSSLLR